MALYKETGDNIYIGKLYTRYTQFTLGVCMKYLKNEEQSKDAVMNVFEKLLTDFHKHEVHNFKSWLHVVAKNYCLMELRKNNPVSESINADYYESNVEFDGDVHHIEKPSPEETGKKIHDAIGKLKPEQQECVKLFFLAEKSYKEIEAETGLSYKEVKSNIQNGRRNLKSLLEGLLVLVLLLKFFVDK